MARLCTPKEVAEQLAVTVQTLHKWRMNGGGPPAIRVGKYLRYDPDELADWLKQNAQPLRRPA